MSYACTVVGDAGGLDGLDFLLGDVKARLDVLLEGPSLPDAVPQLCAELKLFPGNSIGEDGTEGLDLLLDQGDWVAFGGGGLLWRGHL